MGLEGAGAERGTRACSNKKLVQQEVAQHPDNGSIFFPPYKSRRVLHRCQVAGGGAT